MRYVLTVLGVVAIGIGIGNWIINASESEARMAPIKLIVLAGVIVASIGAATIDIVAAINRSKH